MKIIDLIKKINERFPTPADKQRCFDNLVNKSNELHICDLDLALILLGMMFHFKIVDGRRIFVERTELLEAIIDSSYVYYFAASLFADETITLDEEKRASDIAKLAAENLLNGKIEEGGIDAIDKHIILNEIDINQLGVNKTNVVNSENDIQIQLNGNPIFSFPLSQARIKIFNDIIITNLSDEEIRDAQLIITSDPTFINFSQVDIPLLNPHEPILISEFNFKPCLDDLIGITEKIVGNITIHLFVDGVEKASLNKEISYLSFDTFCEEVIDGSAALFVTPNDIAVKNIISLASKELQKLTGDPSIVGYQARDKDNVVMQLKALYNALFNQGIAYIMPPTSFDYIGQKIRTPHDVLVNKQGTCLDLTLLFASCIENMGLNPIVVLIKGHAFVGAFLEDEDFSTAVYYDASKVLEMSSQEENATLFIECTSITAGNTASFEEASAIGKQHVLGAVSDLVFRAIDIQRCRNLGYLPLPIKYDDVERIAVDYEIAEQNELRLARKSYNYKGSKIELTEAELNKFDVWEKKLLDLSKRNQLVSYKITGRGLQLYYYDLNDLYNAFKEDGRRYEVRITCRASHAVLDLPDITEEEYKELKNDFILNRIHLVARSAGQETSLRFFEKERRKSFEETGSNILYLAIGFIRYFETNRSVTPLYAPIVLVPINLIKNSKDSYSICGREEPPFLNISIFEFFHQEFGMNFDDLLTMDLFNDETIDIDTILNTVSQKISKLSRASIVRTAAINILNFSKAVMWSDVKFRREDLIQNKIIKSIVNKKYEYTENDEIDDIFDDESDPTELAIPLPADSSQIIAIRDCGLGKSFILQGPPGTGKSQTITNMIVNAIYHGKTVLFVAEKMAALDVVRKRLSQLCLDKFALEAHSIKADKNSLISQFEKRVALSKTLSSSEDYLTTANQIKEERVALNRVINLLHKENKYFLSFYDAFVNYLDLENNIDAIAFDDDYVSKLDSFEFNEASRICGKLYSQIIENGGYINNTFLLYRNDNYIPRVSKDQLRLELTNYKKSINEFLNILFLFNSANGYSFAGDANQIKHIVDVLKNDEVINKTLTNIIKVDFASIDLLINDICDSARVFQEKIETIRNQFNDGVFSLDTTNLVAQYSLLVQTGFFKRNSGIKKILKLVNGYCVTSHKCNKNDLLKVLSLIEEAKILETELHEKMEKLQIVFGSLNGVNLKDYNFNLFKEKYDFTKELVRNFDANLGLDILVDLVSKLQSYSVQQKADLVNKFLSLCNVESNLVALFNFDFEYRETLHLSFKDMIYYVDQMISKIDYLSTWCSLLKTIQECKDHNLISILQYIENNPICKNDLELVYKKSIYSHIISKSIFGDENGSFNSVDLKHHVEYYRSLIEKFKELTVKETAARVSARMPSIKDSSPASSQQGILNKAIKNKCRGKAIRQLFAEIPDILTKIFPVFLMSPISCAQYLSADMPKFDIVIFDEASQMPTSEAIGAIARGKSLIVVGDSKQMPPTSFFQNKGVEDLDPDLNDLDSILDDCDGIMMPSRCLNWHYRSKHESLIRFSNAKFYGNNLVTFPSPNDLITKITYVNTKGIYGGKKATNEIEARAIIKEVERRLKSVELRSRSIGIVTFSSVQQEMIDDLLLDFFAKHKDLEKINNESKEPIIVKNLENIQGDERDVILFSICYGPDKTGTMHYRFGPINMQGGEKRLNVAISRARYEMMIFASFEPEILSNMKTEAVGALELFNFLKYAKYGSNALIIPNGSSLENKVGFEKHLAKLLEERGYSVEVDVGKSSFRVDIGIINPDNPNEYILGVLCDSYSYQSAITSRDRNIVQPTSLELLGWNLIRVWSFDYLDNPKLVVNNICNLIEDIRANPDKYKKSVDADKPLDIEFNSTEVEMLNLSKPYVCYDKVYSIYGTDDDNVTVHAQILKEILELEAPISFEVLRNRFANAIGVTRAGTQIQQDMLIALHKINAKKNSMHHDISKVFFWLDGQSTSLDYYRVGGSKPRSMSDIPKEEIFVAIKEILINYGAMLKEELKTYVAKAFEIKAVGNKVDQTIDSCMDWALAKGLLKLVDNGARVDLRIREK